MILCCEEKPGTALKRLRDELKISQREAARRLHVSRSAFQRLEAKEWRDLSLSEVLGLASALGLDFPSLLDYFRLEEPGSGPDRCSIREPFSRAEAGDGAHWSSVSRNALFSAGILTLPSQKSCTPEALVPSRTLFGFVLEGLVNLSVLCREYVFKQGDFFTFANPLAGEFYNPHALHRASILIVTLPPQR